MRITFSATNLPLSELINVFAEAIGSKAFYMTNRASIASTCHGDAYGPVTLTGTCVDAGSSEPVKGFVLSSVVVRDFATFTNDVACSPTGAYRTRIPVSADWSGWTVEETRIYGRTRPRTQTMMLEAQADGYAPVALELPVNPSNDVYELDIRMGRQCENP
jgi:hypothetical protein